MNTLASGNGDAIQPGVIAAARILKFEPKLEWFEQDGEGIHGVAHETRVLIWTQILAALACNEGVCVNPDVLGWAAIIHDTRRWDDGIDPDHGARSAEWIETHANLLPLSVPVERVAYLCRWHVPPDRSALRMTDELKVFKDADALDRWRIADLDASYFRMTATRRLLAASLSLWKATSDLDSDIKAFSRIVESAKRLGILSG